MDCVTKSVSKGAEDAQFLIIDEYGPDKRMLMSQLKSLTSGSPKSSFAGNRKSYGASFVPRNDVQVIILSNHHLFYCMGRGREHKISPVDADALRDRFHIIKMDTGAGTEEDDAKRYVEPLYDGSEWSPASLAPKPVLTREQMVEDLNTFGASRLEPNFHNKVEAHLQDLLDMHARGKFENFYMSMISNRAIHGGLYRMTMKRNSFKKRDRTGGVREFLTACAEYPRELKSIFISDVDCHNLLLAAVNMHIKELRKLASTFEEEEKEEIDFTSVRQ